MKWAIPAAYCLIAVLSRAGVPERVIMAVWGWKTRKTGWPVGRSCGVSTRHHPSRRVPDAPTGIRPALY